jgi:hypothetical protein
MSCLVKNSTDGTLYPRSGESSPSSGENHGSERSHGLMNPQLVTLCQPCQPVQLVTVSTACPLKTNISHCIGSIWPLGRCLPAGSALVFVDKTRNGPNEHRFICTCCGKVFPFKRSNKITQKELENAYESVVIHAINCPHLQIAENKLAGNPLAPVMVSLKESDGYIKKRSVLPSRFMSLESEANTYRVLMKAQEEANSEMQKQIGLQKMAIEDHTVAQELFTSTLAKNNEVLVGLQDQVQELTSELSKKRAREESTDSQPVSISRKRIKPHPPVIVALFLQLICPKETVSHAGFRQSTGGYDYRKLDNRLNSKGAHVETRYSQLLRYSF